MVRGRKSFLRNVVGIGGYHPLLRAFVALEHLYCRLASLAGVAHSCVVTACDSTLSLLWSVQLGRLV